MKTNRVICLVIFSSTEKCHLRYVFIASSRLTTENIHMKFNDCYSIFLVCRRINKRTAGKMNKSSSRYYLLFIRKTKKNL